MPLIKRWGLMHCVKPENVAEHSHQVAVIAHLLCVIKKERYNGQLNPDKAVALAIFHEVSETKLQDQNHVVKIPQQRVHSTIQTLRAYRGA